MIYFFAPSQASSQEDCIQVVELLVLKGQKADKAFEFVQTQVQYL